MVQENINWNQLINRLKQAQETSGCKRLKVAAMSVDDLVWASNGPTLGADCTGVKGRCGCIHAEARLLVKALVKRVILTHSPCLGCAELMRQTMVREVFFLKEYRNKDGLKYLIEKGIKCVQL